MKKHHNQQQSESPVQAGDPILIKDNTAKSFEPLYKGNYKVVKVHGNNIKIQDYRGNISMVHITDMKKITLTEQVADESEILGKQGRFNKKCIQSTSNEQEQLECNPTPMDPPEHNQAEIEVNTVKIAPKHYSLMQWTKTLL